MIMTEQESIAGFEVVSTHPLRDALGCGHGAYAPLSMGYEHGAIAPLTSSASAAALGHKNMQAYFYDARFARYWGMGKM